jgi:hypothetical protein
MTSPAINFQPSHEVKLQEKRNERIAEDRRMERLKMKVKVLRQMELVPVKAA